MSFRGFHYFIWSCCLLVSGVLAASVNPKNESFHRATRQRDFDAVQRFVNSRRTINLEEKEGYLTFSGDVRTEYGYGRQHVETKKRVLTAGLLPAPDVITIEPDIFSTYRKGLDAEVNFKTRYKCEKTELLAKIFFDGRYGIDSPVTPGRRETAEHGDPNGLFGSGRFAFLSLKECWLSHIFYDQEGSIAKVFIGRNGLDKLFRSRIQFDSRFNGVLLNYSHDFVTETEDKKSKWNAYGQIAAFVVDERANHFAYAGEVGVIDFLDTHIDIVYSYIYWKKHGRNRAGESNPIGAQFCNSQLWLAYNIPTWGAWAEGNLPKWMTKPTKIYGSMVYNHAARKRTINVQDGIKNDTDRFVINTGKQNFAWDVGILYGMVKKQYDWSFELQYQVVQLWAINQADMAGIGRGNFRRNTPTYNGRGNTNFHGYKIANIFAVTDDLTLETSYQQSWELRRSIGGLNHYYKASVELIQEF